MERVRPGQSFEPMSAADHNAICAAVDLVGRKGQGISGGESRRQVIETDCVRVRNDTGAARRAGDIVGLGASLLTDYAADALWFAGETPKDEHTVFAVLLEPAPHYATEGDRPVVRAQVSGIVLAYVYFTTVTDMGAIPQIGNHVLQSEPARVLYAVVTPPASTGEQLVAVLLSVMHCDALPAA